MANRVHSILQIWDDIRNRWETVYASEAKPTSTVTTINHGAGYNAAATSLTVADTDGILAGDYIKIGIELIQVKTVGSGTVLSVVSRGQLTGTAGGDAPNHGTYEAEELAGATTAALSISDDAVVTKMRLGAPALFKTQIEEKHGSPVVCALELFNRPHTTGSIEGYVEDKYTDYLNEYDRIRVLDNNSKAILFYGRIYRKYIEFDQRYGSVIRITAFDALKELADNRIEGDKGQFTGEVKRSIIVSKIVENLTYQNAADQNINLSTLDVQKFNASVATMSDENEWNYSKGRATGLSAVKEVADGDPHSVSTDPSTQNGYSYFVDNGFVSSLKTTNYTAAIPALNYFQRETIPDSTSSGPTAQTFYKMTYGTQESDGDATNSYTTTVNTLSSFSVSKQYTDVITAITLTYKEANGDINTMTCYRAKVDSVAGTESTAFDFDDLFTTNNSNAETAALGNQVSIAESPIISIDSSTSGGYTKQRVGQLIYIDGTSGNGKFIVFTLDDGFNSEDIHESVLDAVAGKTTDYIRVDKFSTDGALNSPGSAGDPTAVGANRFTVEATSDVDVELLRATPKTFDSSRLPMETRKAVFQMFTSAQTTTRPTRADLSIIDFPFARLTVNPTINTSTNVLTLPVDIYKYGARKGMVVRQLKSGVETGNYGYISVIVAGGSPKITVVLNNEAGNALTGADLPWAASDTFIVYIPIRPGYKAYLTNSPANLTADGLVLGLDYSEGMGIQTTHMNFITDNFAALNESNYRTQAGGAGDTSVSSASRKPVYYDVTAGATVPMLTLPISSDKYRRVDWAEGTLTVGSDKYSIAAGNSYDALSSGWLDHEQWYTLYFRKSESETEFKVATFADLPRDIDIIHIAQLRASADSGGNAIWSFNSSNVILSAEARAAVDISDIADGAIGSSKFVRGAQPFTMTNSVSITTNMWSTSAYNAVAWTAATLAYSDGDTLTVNAGSQTGLSANTTYWAYVTTTSGGIALTPMAATAIGDNKILVALVRVGGSGDVGASILPVGTQAHLVTAASIKEGAVTGDSIKTGTIIADNIAAGAIVSDKIYAGAVITDSIAAGAVIADKIGANEVNAAKLSSTALDSHTITLSTGGKFVTAAGLARATSNQWTTMAGSGTEGGLLIDSIGILGTSKSDDGDIDDTEFYITASDGKFYAGGGSIILDKTGLVINDTSGSFANSRFQVQASGTDVFAIYEAGNNVYLTTNTRTGTTAYDMTVGPSGINDTGTIQPRSTNKVTLGSDSKRFLDIHATTVRVGGYPLGSSGTNLTFNTARVFRDALTTNGGTLALGTTVTDTNIPGSTSTQQHGVFKYAKDGGGATVDTLGFLCGQTFGGVQGLGPVSSDGVNTPAASNHQSSFWSMLSEIESYSPGGGAADYNVSRLIFEPIVSLNYDDNDGADDGYYNYSYLGWHNYIYAINSHILNASNGSAEIPSIGFYSDPNLGMYRVGVDTIGFTANGNAQIAIEDGSIYPLGTTSTKMLGLASYKWQDIYCMPSSSTGSGTGLVVTSSGLFAKITSSIRHKDNVKTLDFDSSKLDNLRPVKFNYKDDMKRGDMTSNIGLIAEEVNELYPELIVYNEEGNPEAVKYDGLSVMLLDVVKKLRKEVKELKGKK
jgi:hypothetical protein